jgi:leucyl aminopeptidase
MKISIKTTRPEKESALVIGIYENGEFTETAKIVDQAYDAHLSKLLKQKHFQGKLGQVLPIFQLNRPDFQCVILVGCGTKEKLNAGCFRRITFSAINALIAAKVKEATLYLGEVDIQEQNLFWAVKQMAEIAHEGVYQFDLFKSQKEPVALNELIISIPNSKKMDEYQTALKQGLAIANGVQFTKNLANLPSNICTPAFLAQQAKELANEYANLKVTVLGEKEMQKLGMGALLGVSQGSAEEAKLICLEYKGAKKKEAPVALVGKGVTFDTGGNSLKTPENMVGMKYDMCGAATVLGTIKAAAELKLPIHLVGVIAAVENMPGGTAYKPEDILTSLSGQTIEIISTDAEGRLALCDALTYCERYKPEVVIDIATLTGAIVIALGFHATGLLTNHQALADDLLKAGQKSYDRAWQLPLWDEYQEQIKSPFADISNSGGRAAGSITAACFLSRFTKKFKWAHLDVAGTAAMMMGGSDRKATGRPIPMLMQYLIDRSYPNAKS